MFMFQSGLLATFIPEFFMIIGFLFCLFTSSKGLPDTTLNGNALNEHFIKYENSTISELQVGVFYQYNVIYAELEKNVNLPLNLEVNIRKVFRYLFSSSELLFYTIFSRPPPYSRF